MQLFLEALGPGTAFRTFGGSLITLVTCMVFGFAGRKIKLITDEADSVMAMLLVRFALPAIVLTSMLRPFSAELLRDSMVSAILMLLIFLLGYVLGIALTKVMRIKPAEGYVWQFSIAFPNVTYFGFPIVMAVFGSEGMIYAAMATVAHTVLAFSLGVGLMRKSAGIGANLAAEPPAMRPHIRQVIMTPALVAVYIGFVLFFTGIRPPTVILDGITMVGSLTTPLAMLIIGSILAKTKLSSILTDLKAYPAAFVRLLVIPLLVYFVLRLFIGNTTMLGVIVILAAMPVATLTVVLAKQYKADTDAAVKMVALTDILCLVTIPILSLIVSF